MSPEDRRQALIELRRMAEDRRFTATRVGAPGCRVRCEAAAEEAILRMVIAEIEAGSRP